MSGPQQPEQEKGEFEKPVARAAQPEQAEGVFEPAGKSSMLSLPIGPLSLFTSRRPYKSGEGFSRGAGSEREHASDWKV